jgi:hypothetical protein
MSFSTTVQDVAAVATAAGFIVAALAILQAKRLSRAQNFFTLAQFLQAEPVRAARKCVLDAKDSDLLPERWLDDAAGMVDDELLAAASLVSSSYDLTGRVVELGYVDHEPFLDDWGPSIKKVFGALEPYLAERREQHNDQRYHDNFERLNESVGWWESLRSWPRLLRRPAYSWKARHRANAPPPNGPSGPPAARLPRES